MRPATCDGGFRNGARPQSCRTVENMRAAGPQRAHAAAAAVAAHAKVGAGTPTDATAVTKAHVVLRLPSGLEAMPENAAGTGLRAALVLEMTLDPRCCCRVACRCCGKVSCSHLTRQIPRLVAASCARVRMCRQQPPPPPGRLLGYVPPKPLPAAGQCSVDHVVGDAQPYGLINTELAAQATEVSRSGGRVAPGLARGQSEPSESIRVDADRRPLSRQGSPSRRGQKCQEQSATNYNCTPPSRDDAPGSEGCRHRSVVIF